MVYNSRSQIPDVFKNYNLNYKLRQAEKKERHGAPRLNRDAAVFEGNRFDGLNIAVIVL